MLIVGTICSCWRYVRLKGSLCVSVIGSPSALHRSRAGLSLRLRFLPRGSASGAEIGALPPPAPTASTVSLHSRAQHSRAEHSSTSTLINYYTALSLKSLINGLGIYIFQQLPTRFRPHISNHRKWSLSTFTHHIINYCKCMYNTIKNDLKLQISSDYFPLFVVCRFIGQVCTLLLSALCTPTHEDFCTHAMITCNHSRIFSHIAL